MQGHLLGQDHLPPGKAPSGPWFPTTPGSQLVQFGWGLPQREWRVAVWFVEALGGDEPAFPPPCRRPTPDSTLSPVKQTLGLGTPKGHLTASD